MKLSALFSVLVVVAAVAYTVYHQRESLGLSATEDKSVGNPYLDLQWAAYKGDTMALREQISALKGDLWNPTKKEAARVGFGEALLFAIAQGQGIAVSPLLESGMDVNYQGQGGASALHRAATKGNTDTVKMLVAYGADPNALDDRDQTPILEAARSGVLGTVTAVLKAPRADASLGLSPLSPAVYGGHLHLIQMLIDNRAPVNEKKGTAGPLHFAAAKNAKQIAQLLIQSGANVNAVGENGLTPIMAAVDTGANDLIRMLLDNYAKPNCQKPDGSTPLHVAAGLGNHFAVQQLLDNGANASAINNEGETPLHRGAFYGSRSVVSILLGKGAYHSPNATILGETPLHIAAKEGLAEVAEVLLKAGADVNGVTKLSKETPLFLAAGRGSLPAVQVLVKRGADLLKPDGEGRTPLKIAELNGHKDVKDFLATLA